MWWLQVLQCNVHRGVAAARLSQDLLHHPGHPPHQVSSFYLTHIRQFSHISHPQTSISTRCNGSVTSPIHSLHILWLISQRKHVKSNCKAQGFIETMISSSNRKPLSHCVFYIFFSRVDDEHSGQNDKTVCHFGQNLNSQFVRVCEVFTPRFCLHLLQ